MVFFILFVSRLGLFVWVFLNLLNQDITPDLVFRLSC